MPAISKDYAMPAISKDYDYRRGHIEVVDSSSGKMRCDNCNTVWWSSLRAGGLYHRGSWTCHNCGANSKGAFSVKAEGQR